MARNKKNTRIRILIGSLVILSFLFVSLSTIFAQENQSVGLSISPLTFEFSANPGDIVENKVKISNPTTNILSVKMEVEDFTASGEEGAVAVEEQENETYSLKRWVTISPTEFTLKPGEYKVVNYTINIPQNAEPGGKYGSILAAVTGTVSPSGTGATVNPKVGALVLLSVSGKVVEKIEIKEFLAPGFSEEGPIPLSLRFENKGTTHEKPKGIITITDIFGKKVADLEIPQKNVIPGAVRKIETQWNKKWLFGGRYQATFVGNYGSQNETITAAIIFWVFPWKIGLLILLILVLIIAMIRRTHRKVKKANQILREQDLRQKELDKQQESSTSTNPPRKIL